MRSKWVHLPLLQSQYLELILSEERKKALYQAIIANRKAKKQANLTTKLGGNTDKIPEINEDHVGNSEKYELIHGAVGENSKRPRVPNKSSEAMKYHGIVNNFATFKRPYRPNKSGKAKGHSGKLSKHIGGTKKPSKVIFMLTNSKTKAQQAIGSIVNISLLCPWKTYVTILTDYTKLERIRTKAIYQLGLLSSADYHQTSDSKVGSDYFRKITLLLQKVSKKKRTGSCNHQ